MFSLISSPSNSGRRATQLFITILAILAVGKLITLVPVMDQLEVAGVFKAAWVIWFLARLAALITFYFFACYLAEAIPNCGGVLSFARGIAEPLIALLLLITVQALFWELLAPFVNGLGRTIYHSSAIILIVCVSIWLIVRAYVHAAYLVDTVAKLVEMLSGLLPQQKRTCPHCHAEMAGDAPFCMACGHKTAETARCAACGTAAAKDQKYCRNCGSALAAVTAAEQ